MNVQDLRRSMVENGIRQDAVDDGSLRQSECFVITERSGVWIVFYAERGLEREAKSFPTEDAACRHLMSILLADPTTRA